MGGTGRATNNGATRKNNPSCRTAVERSGRRVTRLESRLEAHGKPRLAPSQNIGLFGDVFASLPKGRTRARCLSVVSTVAAEISPFPHAYVTFEEQIPVVVNFSQRQTVLFTY